MLGKFKYKAKAKIAEITEKKNNNKAKRVQIPNNNNNNNNINLKIKTHIHCELGKDKIEWNLSHIWELMRELTLSQRKDLMPILKEKRKHFHKLISSNAIPNNKLIS